MVRMNFDPILNVMEQSELSQAVVLPNPTDQHATLRFDLKNTSDVNITVTDLTGKVMQRNILAQLTASTQEIGLSSEQ